jgi:hypothetical protein
VVLGGSASVYHSKVQPTVATSSTEAKAEFVAAAKTTKYLCTVLDELGFQQTTQSPLFEDNEAAISMAKCR